MNRDGQSSDRGVTWGYVTAALAVALLASVAVGMVVGAPALAPPSADDIVAGVEDRYDDAESYTGTVVVDGTYDNGTERVERSARVRVQYRAPGSYRAEVVAPESANGTVMATNGSVAWATRPAGTTLVRPLNETQQGWVERANVSAAVDHLRENATVEKRGTATVDGEEAYVLDVSPRNESADASATVWVSTDDYRLLKMEGSGQHEGETGSVTVTFEAFEFGVSIHDSAFQPPSDRNVVVASLDRTTYESVAEAREESGAVVPTVDAPNHTVTTVAVATFDGDRTATVAYANDDSRLAVVASERDPLDRFDADTETVTVGDREASYATAGDTGVVFWRADGLTYAVAGDQPRDRLVELAGTLST